ncbi:MAG: glycoside hydrolase family 88 protein, partial [Chloroflexota bacterium]
AALMARDAVVRQLPDGRLGIVGGHDAVTDPSASGEAVLVAARQSGDPAMQRAVERQLDWLLNQAPRVSAGPAAGTLLHITNKRQVWVDSYYMAPPFLAVAGHPAEAVRQVVGFRQVLWDEGAQLFHHQWDEDLQDYSRAAFWGVGNGWAAAGMARVIAALPATMSAERAQLIGYVRAVLDGCLAHQRPDGLFHDVVDDASTFVETNLAQMLAYTIYRGVAAGWLASDYVREADAMRAAAWRLVDAAGLVRGVCGAPHFDHPGVAPEGQAFFLLMEAAAADWARQGSVRPSLGARQTPYDSTDI